MSGIKNRELQTTTNEAKSKRGPKAPGTRAGTLLDWREGSLRTPRRRLNSVRDGR